ncbi:transcriptional regulator with XRE-family HTH domain [Microbacterium sp. W4I4]|uniref:helix-turn-helix domain-containing protein n=1 Tax=Microbacterium sp. W4I4 TaxID=3042295 RepID=UPI00278B2CC9|nr:helix-turn-helix transcriptional regulator [Microbacterium sp. W4I4]MDQ0615792.1 transcriptional regulator with XRE-family HTH domain [Microbacterium sp. W4I4]
MVRLPHTLQEIQRGQRLGALLRTERGSRPMLEVALQAGISPETLRKIESGRVATPAFTTIAAVAGVLGLSLDDLWRDAEAAPKVTSNIATHPGHMPSAVYHPA